MAAGRSRPDRLNNNVENIGHFGIDRSHIGKLERGERNVSFMNIVRIGTAIECKPSDLFIQSYL
jgi:DNA-binding Xre family transcriptional regulator